jgi:phage terminase large subunit-like protein
MAHVGWRGIKRIAKQIPNTDIREVDKLIVLPTGGEIQVRSADDPNSLRGEGLDFVVMDECAFMREEAWTEALRPALSDRKGGALFISTPKGRNWFWRMWMSDAEDVRAWRFPTGSNPYIDPGEVASAKRGLPERIFRQEYEAEFIDDAGGVFRRVMECATGEQIDGAQEGRQYLAGVDVATLVDYTVVSVFDIEAKAQVYLDRFNRCDYATLENRLEALYRRFNLEAMVIESNSIGQAVIEAMVSRDLSIIPFTTTNATKQAAIQLLQAAFEHDDIKILPDPVQVGELQSFEGERMPNGAWKYAAPDGLHDDCVMALAIAWQDIGGNSWLIS